MDTAAAIETASGPATPGHDPFDPQHLRISQDFAETVGVKRELLSVPVARPNRQAFIRVRVGDEWRLPVATIEVKEDGDQLYLVDPALAEAMPGEVVPKMLLTSITRQGVVFLWPIRLPGEDGTVNPWHDSAFKAAKRAESRWVRVASNKALGAYDVHEATSKLPEPEWPEASFHDLLRIAFGERLIKTVDHPVLRRLRGEC
jgi:hypothetical protein